MSKILFLTLGFILLMVGLFNFFDPADPFDVRNTGLFYASYIILCLLIFAKFFKKDDKAELLNLKINQLMNVLLDLAT